MNRVDLNKILQKKHYSQKSASIRASKVMFLQFLIPHILKCKGNMAGSVFRGLSQLVFSQSRSTIFCRDSLSNVYTPLTDLLQ